MKGSLRRADDERSRKETSPQGGWFPRISALTALLVIGAILLSALAGATLASLLTDDASPDDGSAEVALGAPAEDSAEAGFARDMMVHHAQAVQMAEIVRDKTESEEIRTIAADIALTQQAQIGQMQGWLAVWGLPTTGPEPPMAWMGHPMEGRMPGMATPEQIDDLQASGQGAMADKAYAPLRGEFPRLGEIIAQGLVVRRGHARALAIHCADIRSAGVRGGIRRGFHQTKQGMAPPAQPPGWTRCRLLVPQGV